MCQHGAIILKGWSTTLPDVIYTINKQPLYGAVSPAGKVNVYGNQELEVVIVSVAINITNPTVEFVPTLCGFRGSGVQRRQVSTREYKHPTEC